MFATRVQTVYTKIVLDFAPIPDVLVLGAGPAALTLAAECSSRGLITQGIAPDPGAPWSPRYGAWRDELPAVFSDAVAHSWSAAAVHTPEKRRLDRPYVCLSTPALQQILDKRCAGMHWVDGFAEGLSHEADATTVRLRSGQRLRARVVVDATGEGALLERSEATPAWQTAYGAIITTRGEHPWPLDEIGLMDFRGEDELPTFLYAQPLAPDRVFLEETTLIRSPEVPVSELRARLFQRLTRMGIDISDVGDEEHCRIRMMGSRPVFAQRAVGFGAAAGMVHPASGYQLARLPAAAEAVAEALASNLSSGPDVAARAAWQALWPAARQRQWALYRFGAQILCDLDAHDTRRFFDAFFKIDSSLWTGFMSATLSPLGLARAMAAVFSAASLSTRRQLLSAGASPSGLDLLRTISRPTP